MACLAKNGQNTFASIHYELFVGKFVLEFLSSGGPSAVAETGLKK